MTSLDNAINGMTGIAMLGITAGVAKKAIGGTDYHRHRKKRNARRRK